MNKWFLLLVCLLIKFGMGPFSWMMSSVLSVSVTSHFPAPNMQNITQHLVVLETILAGYRAVVAFKL